MDLVFRVLGVAAAVNNTMARYSLNFIPSNLIVAVVAACIFFVNVSGWVESVEHSAEPQAVRLAELVPTRTRGMSFIRVAGLLVPGGGFQYGETDKNGNMKRVTMEFVPMVDRESGRGVFVQLPVPHRFGAAAREMELTGMLRPMQEFLARELRGASFEYEGVQMLPGNVLVADDTPGDTASWQLGAALSGLPLALFLYVTVKRNTIFRRHGPSPASEAPGGSGPIELRATGTFILDKHTRRFIEMPAILSPLENGDVAAFANVDASSSFMGVTYANRSGIWALPIARGSLQGVEEGLIYYGLRARPALRFTYRDAVSNKSRRAILSVPTAAACRTVLGDLAAAGAGV